jgi:hypothetical protein
MSWGDSDSRDARAVIRRARKGLDSNARRLAEQRSRVPNTFSRRAAESRHSDVWDKQEELSRPWRRRR